MLGYSYIERGLLLSYLYCFPGLLPIGSMLLFSRLLLLYKLSCCDHPSTLASVTDLSLICCPWVIEIGTHHSMQFITVFYSTILQLRSVHISRVKRLITVID